MEHLWQKLIQITELVRKVFIIRIFVLLKKSLTYCRKLQYDELFSKKFNLLDIFYILFILVSENFNKRRIYHCLSAFLICNLSLEYVLINIEKNNYRKSEFFRIVYLFICLLLKHRFLISERKIFILLKKIV